MENHKEDHKEKSEEKVGVVPVSEIKGSDADSAYPDEPGDTEKQAEQSKDTDASPDE